MNPRMTIQQGALTTQQGEKISLSLPVWQWEMLQWIDTNTCTDIAASLSSCIAALPDMSPSDVAGWYVRCWYSELEML